MDEQTMATEGENKSMDLDPKRALNICMISNRGCIRVIKEAIMLKAAGHNVSLLSMQMPQGARFFDNVRLFDNSLQLSLTVKALDVDIFHVHNEPDSFVKVVRESANPKTPVIYDAHDIESMRSPIDQTPTQDEIDAYKYADGIVHVSEPCRTFAEDKHGKTKPTIIIYSKVNSCFLPDPNMLVANPCYESLVYEGGVSTHGPRPNEDGTHGVQLRHMTQVFARFIQQGFCVSIFPVPAIPSSNLMYEAMGCYVAKPVVYPSMLNALGPHGIGFVGSVYDSPLMQAAMPNKLFEYMSRGVVPICLNAGEASKYVTERNCGYALESIEQLNDIRALTKDIMVRRQNIIDRHGELEMETQTDTLVDFYEEVANGLNA